MSAVCCGRFYNHVTLVNNVYPSEPGETGPRGSALSLLVFYASSKPQKLEKVGLYLEKKLRVDMRKNRSGFTTVTLDILNALIDNCTVHINIISKSLLRIVDEVMGSPEPDLFLQATTTFVKFSAVHSHDFIVDKEFSDLYSKLVVRFCDFSTYETDDSLMQHKYVNPSPCAISYISLLRMHLSGLKAIKAIVSSETFLMNPLLESYVSKIIPAILTNIKNKDVRRGKIRASSDEEKEETALPKRTSITDDLFTEVELENSAEASLQELVSRTNTATLRLFLNRVLSFFDDNREWSTAPDLITAVIRIIAGGVQPQHRYVILSVLLDRLNNDETFTKEPHVKTTLVLTLRLLIVTGGSTVGIAVMELLSTLVTQFQRSVVASGFVDGQTTSSAQENAAQFQLALVECIGALAINLEYPEQLNDIISYVVNRLRLPEAGGGAPRPPSVEGGSVDEIRRGLLQCLSRALVTRYESIKSGSTTSRRSSVVSRHPVATPLLVPVVVLLEDETQSVRIETGRFLHHLLCLEILEGATSPLVTFLTMKTASSANSSGGVSPAEFLALLHTSLYRYALAEWNGPADYFLVGTLFAMLIRRYFADELCSIVPIIFRLQSAMISGEIASGSHQRAVGTLTVEFMSHIAATYSLPDLLNRIAHLRQERTASGQWSSNLTTIYTPSDPTLVTDPIAFDEALEELLPKTLQSLEADLTIEERTALARVSSPLLMDMPSIVASLMSSSEVARAGESAVAKLGRVYVPGEEERELREAIALASSGLERRGSWAPKGGLGRAVGTTAAGAVVPPANVTTVDGMLAPTAGGKDPKVSTSVKSTSIKSEAPSAAVKVEDLLDVLDGKNSTDVPETDNIIMVASAKKNKSKMKGLLRDITVNLEPSTKRSNSPSLVPPSDTLYPRASTDSPSSRSPTDVPAPPSPTFSANLPLSYTSNPPPAQP
ncbi:hypothetical protein HK101_009697, partial [Irineochytrium annulatum]